MSKRHAGTTDRGASIASDEFERLLLNGVQYRVFSEHAEVETYSNEIKNHLIVPDAVQGKPVTIIADRAFADCEGLETATLPNSIVGIGAEAFRACTSLQKIELPSDLTEISEYTFEDCSNLHTVYLPYEILHIKDFAFKNCEKLVNILHYMKTGISAVMVTDRTLVSDTLPVALETIGIGAFSNCVALEKIVIPYRVEAIAEDSFSHCVVLRDVWLHANIKEVGENAFNGCDSLRSLHFPGEMERIAKNAFPQQIEIVCESDSRTQELLRELEVTVKVTETKDFAINSHWGSTGEKSVAGLLADQGNLHDYLNAFELRPPTNMVSRNTLQKVTAPNRPPRFVFNGGVYHSVDTGSVENITIAMVGDLMCRLRQQAAGKDDQSYNFDSSFEYVRGILTSSDFTIGNMETMISRSFPYMSEVAYIDDRPYLNAPNEFVVALRNAGFDAVTNAQNHLYDAGVLGVLETLDAMNEVGLIHGGMYASEADNRFQLLNIKGFKIGVVSYLDGARQKMKQANFTDPGLTIMASLFDETKVREDVLAAKEAGAEFILAFCHWGREYTTEITERQESFARMVANSGADYIFGSHSHCPQPYSVIMAEDGRKVPVVYSGGNFLSDMDIKPPLTRDSFVSYLRLARDPQGKIIVGDDGYVPCRIIDAKGIRGHIKVVPCETLTTGVEGYDPILVDEDVLRIQKALGDQYRMVSLKDFSEQTGDGADPSRDTYGISKPSIARLKGLVPEANRSELDDDRRRSWRDESDDGSNEVVILAAGLIRYDEAWENIAAFGPDADFRTSFKHLLEVTNEADFAIAGFDSLIAPGYPSSAARPVSSAKMHYSNARVEILKAIKFGGFDCLALAQPFNLDLGEPGVQLTVQATQDAGLLPSGLGTAKNPQIAINGINFSAFSYSMEMYARRNTVTHEGLSALLNVFSQDRAREDFQRARSEGSQFILAYLDFRSLSGKYRLRERIQIAKEMAEAGADYIICIAPGVTSKYLRFKTSDGRLVPIATSLGTFMSGKFSDVNRMVAALKITLRRNSAGEIEFTDTFIPFKRFRYYDGAILPTVPAHRYYNEKFVQSDFRGVRTQIEKCLTDTIEVDGSRRVKISTHNVPQLTFEEISRTLEVSFSQDDLIKLKDHLQNRVSRVINSKNELEPGCVAVLVNQTSYQKTNRQMSVEDAERAGAAFLIADQDVQTTLPTLRVRNAWDAYHSLTAAIRSKYSPITVAVTGTVGKTTTKELLQLIFERQYRTLAIEGNNNSLVTVGRVIQKLTARDEAYIQEVHGGSPGSARTLSTLIKPNISIITEIGDGHIQSMGSVENIVKGKLEITEGMPKDGVLILNNDNEYLANVKPDIKTVRYSVKDEECEYFADKIIDHGEKVTFDVVSPVGRHSATLNFQGIHNVSNALAAFAAATLAKIPPHKIIAGLASHSPNSVRQNLTEHGGYRLLIDTYSSTPPSVISAVETLSRLEISARAKRIAVLSEISFQGSKALESHRSVGEAIKGLNFDLVLCVGEHSKEIVRVLKSNSREAYYFRDHAYLNDFLVSVIEPGDLILFKGGESQKLKEKTIYPIFGRII